MAVVASDAQLSYAELLSRSQQLAREVVGLGVAADQTVGLLLQRTSAIPVAVYGVWRAGAAYVPIDPNNPPERIRQILGLSRAQVLVCERATAVLAQSMHKQVIVLDDLPDPALRSNARTELPAHPDPASLAYVLFTSGSTGEPKGVMVEHRQVQHLAAAFEQRMAQDGLDISGRWAANPPYTFDMSTFDFLRLTRGDTLYVLDEQTRRDPEALINYLVDHAIDVIGVTPAQMQMLLEARSEGQRLPSAVVAGEAISGELWQKISEHYADGDRWAINLYGPTEATMGTTTAQITECAEVPTIGASLPGYRCSVRDSFGGSVPLGVPGELFIAGGGVARGYLGRDDLTLARFSPPSTAGENQRWYQSGDIVCWSQDGRLEYLGRTDNQVKVRGHRIELGEIEQQLRSLPSVANAVALVWRGAADAQLIAFVTLKASDAGYLNSVRDQLKALLPDYMIPARVVAMDELPMTAHGKLDRNALLAHCSEPEPEPEADSFDWSEHEKQVAELCRGLLKLPSLRMTDNFFDLGGHSLLVVRLAAALEELSGVRPALRELFNASTLVDVAALVPDTGNDCTNQADEIEMEEFQW